MNIVVNYDIIHRSFLMPIVLQYPIQDIWIGETLFLNKVILFEEVKPIKSNAISIFLFLIKLIASVSLILEILKVPSICF